MSTGLLSLPLHGPAICLRSTTLFHLDILDLSRIAADKLELYAVDIDLRSFLGVVADIVRIKAEERSQSFVFEAADDLPQAVRVDDKRLRQVLLNLLGNAVTFTDRGGIRLRRAICALRSTTRRTGAPLSNTRYRRTRRAIQECREEAKGWRVD